MARCWCEHPEERPDFGELCSIMDQFLCEVSDYVELGMVLIEEPPEAHGNSCILGCVHVLENLMLSPLFSIIILSTLSHLEAHFFSTSSCW